MTATYPSTASSRQAPEVSETAAHAPSVPAYRPFDVTVRSITRLSPHFVRLTFTGHDLDLFGDTCLDQHIKVVFPLHPDSAAGSSEHEDPFGHFPRTADWYARWRGLPEELRNPFRTYTVRAVRPALREVDVDFVSHGDTGVASAWLNRVRQGDHCVLVGPDRRGDAARVGVTWKPGTATNVLLAGDETALPAIGSILASLPEHTRGRAFVEVPGTEDALPVSAPPGVEITWLPRSEIGSPEANHGRCLVSAVVAAVSAAAPGAGAGHIGLDESESGDGNTGGEQQRLRRLWDIPDSEPDGGTFTWLAGEARAITTLRRHLVRECGWDRSRIAFMGYWRAGTSGG